ncbi:hypothetical protein GOP47_0000930 [Adiantum capillus-veneris]|uniref:non-specific serine/threonine protein kinase n=1 Tax=Adiantum capillus-veneris TaxID=13818 RepID=A0A9D4ZSR3_ADICA|nr:hypothetical protein GOP47_0000930 [Adiantum capillus-veneris]
MTLPSTADTTKEALLSQSSGHCDEQLSGLAVHAYQSICVPFWKKLGSPSVPRFSYHTTEAPVDIKRCSKKDASTAQGNDRILPEYETFAQVHIPCGSVTFSPISCPWRTFTLQEMRDSTNNFHGGNVVGKGGFAMVYKGTLPGGKTIAIKKLSQSYTAEHREKDFLVEIGIMAHVCHPNTTPLVGFCLEGGLYLIYKFYPNGSLAEILHGTKSKSFDWPSRYKVALGVAQGLFYLHEQCRRRIIHRDIKASNILLDGDFEPQISDFGLAKWLPKEWSHHSVSAVEGTFGYLAPEYQMHGIVDEKIDVYSFGVLLLEIISGRRPVDNDQQFLVHWAKPFLETRNIQELADPGLRGCYDYQQMRHMIATCEMCIRQSSLSRPTMNQVVRLLSSGV